MKKKNKKRYLRLVDDKCPLCRKKLAVWVRHSDKEEFIGCSGFPNCRYTKDLTRVDFARKHLGIPIDWGLSIDGKLFEIFNQCQSRPERAYLLGAIYYLGTSDFDDGYIVYKNEKYSGLVFNQVHGCLKVGGYSPTSLAIVSQLVFGNNYHHVFGIFFSHEKHPSSDQWELGVAVEIDYHPEHEWNPGKDKYRDSLVQYDVLRLNKGDDAKEWFRKVEFIYNSIAEASFEA